MFSTISRFSKNTLIIAKSATKIKKGAPDIRNQMLGLATML